MKNLLWIGFFAFLLLGSCKKSGSSSGDESSSIIEKDSSQFNGRLYINTLDYFSGSKISNADVYLYTSYEDIYRHLYLNYKRTGSDGTADFGYILQGNYYVVSSGSFNKYDTTLVQVLGQKTLIRNVYLR